MAQNIVTFYREKAKLRNSFNVLAQETFGIDFEPWYQLGFWTDRYQPYSIEENGEIIANASVNKLTFHMHGMRYSALQIGTVMTKADYRRQGHARKLMQHIFNLYDDYDIIYLFANKEAKAFYETFDFRVLQEHQYVLNRSFTPTPWDKRIMDMHQKLDRDMLINYCENKYINNVFDVSNNGSIAAFYATLVFPENFYYIESLDAIVVATISDSVLTLHDVICDRKLNLLDVIPKVIDQPVKQVVFGFTPELKAPDLVKRPIHNEDSTWYVRSKIDFELQEKHPEMALA